MIVLGIETSCDETAAALVNDRREILGAVVAGQMEDHEAFGGVVPEIAARAHLAALDQVVQRALSEANLTLAQIDAVAATCGPGLIGGVLVGATYGKALAWARDLPFLPINHLEGHALTARLTDDVPFPFLLLLVSGGHCQLL
ncbi:MAG: tRNA (adenosine(37)-N6)-threonylcarbamoyltransferase complex transferase subunit TsaD, partial [Elsteraceae bacterium]